MDSALHSFGAGEEERFWLIVLVLAHEAATERAAAMKRHPVVLDRLAGGVEEAHGAAPQAGVPIKRDGQEGLRLPRGRLPAHEALDDGARR